MKNKHPYTKKLRTIMTSAAVLSTLVGVASPIAMNATRVHADTVNSGIDTSTPEAFIKTIGPKAQKVASENGMYASVMIAQAIIESGSGSSGLSQAPNYNLFGIKGTGSAGTVNMNTGEDGASGSYTINAGFRKYNSYDESLQDNAKVITGNAAYTNVLKANAPTYQDATASLQGTYATSTVYASTLNSTIERYNLTQYDNGTATATTEATGSTNTATTNSTATTLTDAQILEKYKVAPDYKIKDNTTTEDVKYKTTADDSVWGIARANKVSIDQLKQWNSGLTETQDLKEGTELKVGEKTTTNKVAYKDETVHHYDTYKIVNGDSLWKIAQEKSTTVNDLTKLNNLGSDYMLYGGQDLKIKDTPTTEQHILTDAEKKASDDAVLVKAKAMYSADQAKAQAQTATTPTAQSTNATTNSTVNYDKTNVSTQRQQVIALASQQIGKPYVWGANGASSFDCSGLVQYSFKNALNMDVGRTTYDQEKIGTRIAVADAKAGDLFFWQTNGDTYHVAIALGNGQFIAAPRPGQNVEVENVKDFAPQFATSVLA